MSLRTALWNGFQSGRSDTQRRLRQLDDWQWLEGQDALALQRQRLQSIVCHAYEHSPYYRDVLGEAQAVTASGRADLSNFERIPTLDKAILRSRFEDMKSDDLSARNWYENTSGGSTGEPVRLVQDGEYHAWIMGAKLLFDRWTGYSPGDSQIRLWGSERDLFVGKDRLRTRAGRWLRNETWLNAFRMTPGRMRDYVRAINAHRPVQLLGYVESVYDLARFIDREQLGVYSPKAIMTSAGTLYPHMRQTIECVFQAPVFNRYGTREVGDIACECDRHKGLHVVTPAHYVEILRDDGTPAPPGEMGEVVITSMVNYAMPHIRYRIGDMASWSKEPCGCGRHWGLLEEVGGRVTDSFVRRDGGVAPPEYLIHLVGVVLNKGWVLRFQIVQEDYELVRVLVVPRNEAGRPQERYSTELAEIGDKIRLVMGETCKVECEFVDKIDAAASGKYRYTISKVAGRVPSPAAIGAES